MIDDWPTIWFPASGEKKWVVPDCTDHMQQELIYKFSPCLGVLAEIPGLRTMGVKSPEDLKKDASQSIHPDPLSGSLGDQTEPPFHLDQELDQRRRWWGFLYSFLLDTVFTTTFSASDGMIRVWVELFGEKVLWALGCRSQGGEKSKNERWDFLGSLMIRTLSSNAGDLGSYTWSGR